MNAYIIAGFRSAVGKAPCAVYGRWSLVYGGEIYVLSGHRP